MTGTEPKILVATFAQPSSTRRSTQLATEKRPNTCRGKSEGTIRTQANWYPEDMSKSRISAQSPLPETVENKSMGEKVTQKLDFHLMEGPLERKPVLHVGGRKASSRTWGTFYAVLVRRTLCVYHEHKYSTKSSASASPLHLTGAVCTPESDYTKKDNCFRLRLMDGSEYLFRAPTPESLHQWVIKLRHNSGMEASDLLRDAVPASEMSSRIMSGSLMLDLCQSIPAQSTDLARVAKPPYWKKTSNVTAEVPKLKCHYVPGESMMVDDADPENNSTRRRSQSFSSVLYQKVTATLDTEDPSSFSVTLFIGDRLLPRGRSHSFAAPPLDSLRRNTTDLKSQNKSVLSKFFKIATFCFVDCFAHSWHSLDEL
ncbi:unnamed protein product [Ranitomeya imitator]|uniref:PH domain-containing protein n=1 Tax=Ranitomeya imitator TaxID=111125 RepID=A0ABN9M6U1_9NEOB|nr:unnamed protein product [Ranitomeya imitator]